MVYARSTVRKVKIRQLRLKGVMNEPIASSINETTTLSHDRVCHVRSDEELQLYIDLEDLSSQKELQLTL